MGYLLHLPNLLPDDVGRLSSSSHGGVDKPGVRQTQFLQAFPSKGCLIPTCQVTLVLGLVTGCVLSKLLGP